MWFGTYGGGLNELPVDQLNLTFPEFIKFMKSNNLGNDIIYGIEGDRLDHLWLSTDNGLSMFNIKTQKFQNYDEEDGLQGNQFYWGASFKGINSELFFGEQMGLILFSQATGR